MRKLSEINEGLWKPALNRITSGDFRKEESNISHLREGEDIGLSFMVANDDFKVKDEDGFTYDELLKYQPLFEKYGWRVPTYEEGKMIVENCRIKMVDSDTTGALLGKRKRNEGVTINRHNHFWVIKEGAKFPFMPFMVISPVSSTKALHLVDDMYLARNDKKQIRLIRDKK